jgi:hypothetical protein
MKTGPIKWTFVGELVVSFTGGGVLLDQDWDALILDMKTKPVKGYLATNYGSIEVSSVQRQRFAENWKVKKFPVAVVTNERLVRGLVTATSWLGVNIKAFDWTDLRVAVRHLGATESEAEVLRVIQTLMQQCKVGLDLNRLTGL